MQSNKIIISLSANTTWLWRDVETNSPSWIFWYDLIWYVSSVQYDTAHDYESTNARAILNRIPYSHRSQLSQIFSIHMYTPSHTPLLHYPSSQFNIVFNQALARVSARVPALAPALRAAFLALLLRTHWMSLMADVAPKIICKIMFLVFSCLVGFWYWWVFDFMGLGLARWGWWRVCRERDVRSLFEENCGRRDCLGENVSFWTLRFGEEGLAGFLLSRGRWRRRG